MFSFTRKTVSHGSCTVSQFCQQCMRGPVSRRPGQHLIFSIIVVSAVAILARVTWYLIATFICISLVTDDSDHLFIYLLAIYISSLEKCLFKSFAYFKIGLFSLLLSFKHYFYLLDTRSLSDIRFANVSSILVFVSHALIARQRTRFNLDEVQSACFSSVVHGFRVMSKKSWPNQRSCSPLRTL